MPFSSCCIGCGFVFVQLTTTTTTVFISHTVLIGLTSLPLSSRFTERDSAAPL